MTPTAQLLMLFGASCLVALLGILIGGAIGWLESRAERKAGFKKQHKW